MNDEITIGLAAYNGATTIAKSIESLLNQSYTNFKIIISDDGSDDGTIKIARHYELIDPRIKCIRQRVNLGPLGNFTETLKLSDTEYFMWASQDDLWSKNFIETGIIALKNNPAASYTIPHWICESRYIPALRRVGLPRLQFLEAADKYERVIEFTKLPFVSFKDNITYGLYRKKELLKNMSDLEGKIKYFSIGGVHNEFIVLNMQAVYTPNAILRKRYKYLPPGHILNTILEPIALELVKYNYVVKKSQTYPRYSSEDYMKDLETVLNLYGVPQDVYKKAIEINIKKLDSGIL